MIGQETKATDSNKETWLKKNLVRPGIWIAVGFVACKIFDAYIETKKTKRITS